MRNVNDRTMIDIFLRRIITRHILFEVMREIENIIKPIVSKSNKKLFVQVMIED